MATVQELMDKNNLLQEEINKLVDLVSTTHLTAKEQREMLKRFNELHIEQAENLNETFRLMGSNLHVNKTGTRLYSRGKTLKKAGQI